MLLRSHKVTFMFKHPFLLDIFDVKNLKLLKLPKSDNIINPRLTLLWTTSVLV